MNKNEGIKLSIINNTITIKGTKEDLHELATYIKKLANSSDKEDHIHIDNLTLISNDSCINELIIEKENM